MSLAPSSSSALIAPRPNTRVNAGRLSGRDAKARISGAIFNGDELLYRPVSADQEAMLVQLEGRIPIVRTEDVFQFAHASHRHDDTWMDTGHPQFPA